MSRWTSSARTSGWRGGASPSDQLIAAANRIFHPYTLDVKEVAWWSVYEIGQRLADRFDDLPDDAPDDRQPRVFIAGDACHTHSPKAGQGMNVSMRDAFNLGWKLAAVIEGRADPRLLRTYSEERQAVARTLIEFDREWSRIISARPKIAEDVETEGYDPALFQDYFVRSGRYTAGTAIRYAPSLITGDGRHQALAAGFPTGMRFHSAPVVRLADAKPMHLGHAVTADGRWRLFAFASDEDPAGPSAIRTLCGDLAAVLRRFTPEGADIDAAIDLRAVFQQGHREIEVGDMPGLLRPEKGRYGLRDQEKMFCADPAADIFDMRGIDRARGALVVVRPDQHVGHVLPLDGACALAEYFAGFLVAGRG